MMDGCNLPNVRPPQPAPCQKDESDGGEGLQAATNFLNNVADTTLDFQKAEPVEACSVGGGCK